MELRLNMAPVPSLFPELWQRWLELVALGDCPSSAFGSPPQRKAPAAPPYTFQEDGSPPRNRTGRKA